MYCVKCKKNTGTTNQQEVKTSNGRRILTKKILFLFIFILRINKIYSQCDQNPTEYFKKYLERLNKADKFSIYELEFNKFLDRNKIFRFRISCIDSTSILSGIEYEYKCIKTNWVPVNIIEDNNDIIKKRGFEGCIKNIRYTENLNNNIRNCIIKGYISYHNKFLEFNFVSFNYRYKVLCKKFTYNENFKHYNEEVKPCHTDKVYICNRKLNYTVFTVTPVPTTTTITTESVFINITIPSNITNQLNTTKKSTKTKHFFSFIGIICMFGLIVLIIYVKKRCSYN